MRRHDGARVPPERSATGVNHARVDGPVHALLRREARIASLRAVLARYKRWGVPDATIAQVVARAPQDVSTDVLAEMLDPYVTDGED